jgi:pimeloyl-ACP methyl ester carboxylesterase
VKRFLATSALLALLGCVALLRYDRPPAPPGAWLQAAGLEERFATVDGLRVRYVRTGRGPAVLLLHGFASSIYSWKDVIPELAADLDVVALDLPGFGWSDQPADLTFDHLPRVVLSLMRELGIDRASLVGNSLGGAVSAVVAAEQPERVERLVLVDSAGFNLRPEDRPPIVRLTSHPLAEFVITRLPVRRLLVTAGLRQVFYDDAKVTEDRVNEYLAAASRPGTLASIRSLRSSAPMTPEALTEMLRRVEAPTLVIWGAEDSWIRPADAEKFVAAIPGARKVILPAAGHTPQEERPEEVARLLREFLVTVRTESPSGPSAAHYRSVRTEGATAGR